MATTLTLEPEVPPVERWPDGTLRLRGSRILLDRIVDAYNSGDSAEEILDQLPVLTPCEVHRSLGWYLGHREQVDAELAERARQAELTWLDLERAGAVRKVRPPSRE